jgi:hypothetical protein
MKLAQFISIGWRYTVLTAALLGGPALLASCSSSSSSSSTSIGASGGSVNAADGTAVSIPAGALSQSTVITIGSEPSAIDITDVVLVGPAYRFGPEGTSFALPVTVTLAYDPSKLPTGDAASDVQIMTAPVGSTDFVALDTTLVDATHVSATTTHFSVFVAAAHKSPHADHGVSMDLGPSDQGNPPADQALSSADQSTPVDANLCPHAWNPMTCTLTANATTCGGSYSLNCQQNICFCSLLNSNLNKTCPKPSPSPNNFGCPSQSDEETVWTTCCGYP